MANDVEKIDLFDARFFWMSKFVLFVKESFFLENVTLVCNSFLVAHLSFNNREAGKTKTLLKERTVICRKLIGAVGDTFGTVTLLNEVLATQSAPFVATLIFLPLACQKILLQAQHLIKRLIFPNFPHVLRLVTFGYGPTIIQCFFLCDKPENPANFHSFDDVIVFVQRTFILTTRYTRINSLQSVRNSGKL